MVVVDKRGIPLNTVVESALVHEGHLAEETVDGIGIKKQDRRRKHPLVKKPKRVIADKGFDDDALRERLDR